MGKKMKYITIIMCWLITAILLLYTNNTVNEFNNVIKNVEDNSQSLLIDSLQLEIMQIGSELDSIYLKYN
jgi:cell division protein FtsL